jgi:hypothetical protein
MTIPLNQLTAEPTTVVLDGKHLELSPLRIADVGNMEKWFCELPLEQCNEQLKKYGNMYHEKKRRKLVDKADAEYQLRLDISNGHERDEEKLKNYASEMRKVYSSLEGTARLLWLSLRKTSKDLTLDDAKELVTLDTMNQISDALMAVSYVRKSEDEKLMDEDDEKKTK